jgi:delta 1-pyrroline-5-carboxylate dehydrogenase
MIIMAPHELPQAAITVPSPQFGDGEGCNMLINRQTSISGVIRTYVKQTDKQFLQYNWNLSRRQAEEFMNFCGSYGGVNWRIIDHENQTWVVTLVNDTIAQTYASAGERVDLSLDFEGVRLA